MKSAATAAVSKRDRETKCIFFALVALVAVASAACRQYEVDAYRNVNGRVPRGVNYGVSQSFVCTADSLLWAEFFVGAANSGGHYEFDIKDGPSGSVIYKGASDTCNPNMHYMFVRASLVRQTNDPLVKGKEYVLKVWLSSQHLTDSLNYYFDNTNPYLYGEMSVGGTAQIRPDLCARIEGVNRPVDAGYFGAHAALSPWGNLPDTLAHIMDYARAAGVSWVRDHVGWETSQPNLGKEPDWSLYDGMFRCEAQGGTNILGIFDGTGVPAWASTHIDAISNGSTVWSKFCPPRNLFKPIKDGNGHINTSNWFGYWVYRAVGHYCDTSSFWNAVGLPGAGIETWEVGNEPNFWVTPNRGRVSLSGSYDVLGSSPRDSIALAESLYARYCDVAIEAAHLADPNARVLVGSLGAVELGAAAGAHEPRRVKGKEWLRAYYRCRNNSTNAGVTVHPYQYGNAATTFNYESFVRDLDTVRAIMRDGGDEGKQLWATELGWLGGDTLTAELSLPKAYVSALAGDPVNFYDRIIWFVLRDDLDPSGKALWQSSLLGNQHQEFAPRPCYYAYRQMTQELLGKRINGRILSGDSTTDAKTQVYELEDPASRKKTWVGWRSYQPHAAGVAVNIPARTDELDIALLERRTDADQSDFGVTVPTDGWKGLTLDVTPVYVHETGTIARPDLVVDSTWTSENLDNAVTLHARVKNIGNKEYVSPGKTGSAIRFAIDGAPVDPVAEPKRLATGGLAFVRSAPVSPDRGIAHLVSATANPDRDVMELDFDNNAGYCPLPTR